MKNQDMISAQQARDEAVMRQALRELRDGKGLDVDAAFDSIRAALLKMKVEAVRPESNNRRFRG